MGVGFKRLGLLLVVAGSAVSPSDSAGASCTCECVDGHMQPLCDSAINSAPICPPRLCPLPIPSLAPLNPPTLPPLGTSACREARVCDGFGNCRWQQVCR